LEKRLEQMAQIAVAPAAPDPDLVNKVKELEEQLQKYRSKPIKLGTPDKFDGTRHKLRSFLASMAIHMDVNRDKLLGDADRVAFVAAHFTGKAMNWFETYLNEWMGLPEEHRSDETKSHLIGKPNLLARHS
jgi:hypothetical protein